MSVQIESLKRDPDIVAVAEGLGVPLDEYVEMVAKFVANPNAELEVQLLAADVTGEVSEVAAWITKRLAGAPGDSFARRAAPRRSW